jgi:2-dehydropantoate 2-reductase
VDFGRYPFGTDETSREIAAVFARSTFDSHEISDLMPWKWRKLLTNLSNAIEVVCGSGTRTSFIADFARDEAAACLDSAGITYRTSQDDKDRRANLLQLREIGGRARPGGSTWQSIARSASSIETSYLNGQIAVVGRADDIPTPVNTLLVRMCEVQHAIHGQAPEVSIDEFLTLLSMGGGVLAKPVVARIESNAAPLRPEVEKFWAGRLGFAERG